MIHQLKFMQCWDRLNTIWRRTAINPECNSETKIVWVSHHESTFYSNDDAGKGWGSDDHPDIHKKQNGWSIMVSDFICPCDGQLCLGA
jgi:hypothetical protein